MLNEFDRHDHDQSKVNRETRLWSRVWTRLTPNRALNNARLGTIKINGMLVHTG
jgi:hypothetical protein